jgi:hypothetical protein
MARTTSLVGTWFLLASSWAAAQSPLTYAPPPAPPPAPAVDPIFTDWGPPLGQQTPGWFAGAEIALRQADINATLVNQIPLGSLGEFLHVPAVDLPLTVSPTFEIGYRLPQCAGTFSLRYHFLTAEGTGTVYPADNTFRVRTRLDMQVFDLDYGTAPYEFAPRWEVSARLGGRLANVFFDSQAVNDAVSQQASNNFFGAGIHGRVDVERRLVVIPGLGLFGRLDGAVLTGRVRQRFHLERFEEFSELEQRSRQTVSALNAQVGLSYSPPGLPGLKFATGYEWEQYWNVGRLNGQDGAGGRSSGDVWSHGWFLRAQVDF